MPSSSVTPDPRAGEPSLLGKRIAPRPLFCPVASAPHAALHWGQGAGPGDHLRQMWTHSTFCPVGPGGLPAKCSARTTDVPRSTSFASLKKYRVGRGTKCIFVN